MSCPKCKGDHIEAVAPMPVYYTINRETDCTIELKPTRQNGNVNDEAVEFYCLDCGKMFTSKKIVTFTEEI